MIAEFDRNFSLIVEWLLHKASTNKAAHRLSQYFPNVSPSESSGRCYKVSRGVYKQQDKGVSIPESLHRCEECHSVKPLEQHYRTIRSSMAYRPNHYRVEGYCNIYFLGMRMHRLA